VLNIAPRLLQQFRPDIILLYLPAHSKVGKLDKWDEDIDTWPELTEEEKEALNKCTIM
jgi:hypothetical protein